MGSFSSRKWWVLIGVVAFGAVLTCVEPATLYSPQTAAQKTENFKRMKYTAEVRAAGNFEEKSAGLPFNLPGTRYCTPCTVVSGSLYHIESVIDSHCLMYALSNSKKQIAPYRDRLKMLKLPFDLLNEVYAYVIYTYIEAKNLYEEIFNTAYDFSSFVVPTISNSSCIQIYQDGVGFSRENVWSKLLNDSGANPWDIESAKMFNSLFIQGKSWETRFIEVLRDVWVTFSCNTDPHKDYVKGAASRLKTSGAFDRRVIDPVSTIELPWVKPNISDRFTRPCGDNETVPIGLVSSVGSCGDMFCSITTSRPPTETVLKGRGKQQHSVAPKTKVVKKTKVHDADTRYLINEFYPRNPTQLTVKEFIEIRVFPAPETETFFPNLKLLAITLHTKRLFMMVNLYHRPIQSNGYYVIHEDHISRSYVQTDSKEERNYKLLPTEGEPIGILLLQKKETVQSSRWTEIELGRKRDNTRYSISLADEKNSEILSSINAYIIDAVFYGLLRNQEVPEDVKQLLPSIAGCNFILPTGDTSKELEMQSSFNLCSEPPDVFQISKFKLGNPSMGQDNDCTSSMYQLDKVEQSTEQDSDDVGVTKKPKTDDDCPRSEPAIGGLINEIDSQIGYIRRKYNPSYNNAFYPTETFVKEVWPRYIDQLEQSVEYEGTATESYDLTPFEVMIGDQILKENPEAIPRARYVRCSICFKRQKQCPQSVHFNQRQHKLITGLQMETSFGSLLTKFKNHLNSQQHLTSILYDVEKDRINLERKEGEQQQYQYAKTQNYRQLANIFDVTFTFLHTNTAPTNAAEWYKTLRKIEAEVGTSQHSRDTAFAIISFVAAIGTDSITKQLINNDDPFTLILDGSSDTRNKHYVLVYMQSLEGGMTYPYLMFILELKQFDAIAYRNVLVAAVSAKGTEFENYFKRNIVGIVTDSASVMKLFHTLMNKWIKRTDSSGNVIDLVSVYCLAHKLQLSSRSSFVPLKSDKDVPDNSPILYYRTLEKFMQTSYTWFKWSGKRIGLFREISEREGFPRVELKELHLERWISSEYQTVRSFLMSWKTARTAIEEMTTSKELDKKTVKEANDILPQFSDKTALITLHFIWEYTSVFKVWSEYLQKMAGLLIDQKIYFDKLVEDLKMLREFSGPVLTSFLKQCRCDEEECTVESYERSTTIRWNGFEFTDVNAAAPKFSEAVDALIAKTNERLQVYIPMELIKAAFVLNPKNFPPGDKALSYQHPVASSEDGTRVYGEKDIRILAKLLGFAEEQLLQDWAVFFKSMITSPSWVKVRPVDDSNTFWAILLRDDKLTWTPTLRRFVKAMKTLAPGSVACETGFSVFNVLKSKWRMKMSDAHVEAILKILLNGPGKIEFFDSYRYAQLWILAGKRFPQTEELTDQTEESDGMCPDPNLNIEDDLEYTESDFELFPDKPTTPIITDTYSVIAKSKEFKDNTKQRRTEARFRSKIM